MYAENPGNGFIINAPTSHDKPIWKQLDGAKEFGRKLQQIKFLEHVLTITRGKRTMMIDHQQLNLEVEKRGSYF